MAAIRTGDTVTVRGLDELRKALRQLDEAGIVDRLKAANFDVAALVVERATARGSGLGRMEARAAQTLRAGRQAARATVSLGGASAPFAGGAEFGAGQDRPRTVRRGATETTVRGWNQFEPWRGNGQNAGYFLYPTIRDQTPQIVEMYGDAIERLTADAFPT